MSRRTKDVSIYRIAEETGVSVPTVSRVINKRAGISEATRNKVNTVLYKYNFSPDYPAIRTVKIAVVYPFSDLTDYFRKAVKGIYEYAENNKLMVNIIIANSLQNESLLEAVRDQQCSGVIALLPECYRDKLDILVKSDLLTVLVDSMIQETNVGFIDNDSSFGTSAAVKHLLDLGHNRIAYLTYKDPSLNQLQRFKAAENTLKLHNIEFQLDSVIRLGGEQLSPIRGKNGYTAMKLLLSRREDITAVIAVDDSMALGAMTAIHEHGLKIPEDISIVGFDNYPETEIWYPALTTINHPVEQAGHMAIEAIHKGLKNPTDWIPPREILQTQLVIRKSTGKAPK